MKRLIAIAVGVVAMGVPNAARTQNAHPPSVWTERTFWTMGTALSVRVAAADRTQALAAAEAVYRAAQATDRLLSSWSGHSEVGRLNNTRAGMAYAASASLITVLSEVQQWSHCMRGAFDPVIGALVEAWDLRGAGRYPDAVELQDALLRSGMRRLRIDDAASTLTWDIDGAWLDAGAFGKGAALRAARHALDSLGIQRAQVDFGGHLLLIGADGDGESGHHVIGIAHPQRRTEPAVRMRLRDTSVATSGQSERFVVAAGRRIGHVIDPRTGLPVPPWGSVTVVTPDPLLADVLSTALFVMGPDGARAWAATAGKTGVLVLELRDDGVAVYANTHIQDLLDRR
jgi:thiamine biosynthesis lipoprotein